MKKFLVGLFATAAILVLSQSVQAQPMPKQDGPKSSVADVEVNKKKIASITLPHNGNTEAITLPSGHKITLQMKNGRPTSVVGLNGSGQRIPTQVHEEAARRVIIIIIRDGGTVIVIVIRQRVA
jgi:hypothetical protein